MEGEGRKTKINKERRTTEEEGDLLIIEHEKEELSRGKKKQS